MATSPPRVPVMADVARLAGVSHQTVSRVLNGSASVAPETRRNVETAIKQLSYRRNRAARALVTNRTRTLGVISVDTSHYGPASTLFAIESAAREADYFLSFVSLRYVDGPNMRSAASHLLDANVDGLIVIAPLATAVDALQGLRTEVPLVRVIPADSTAAGNNVMVDQEAGAGMATRHLLSLGHDTVHHLRGPVDWLEADARVRGWLRELVAARARVPEALIGDWSPESGYLAGREILRMPEVTAVFAANDQMALGLILALSEGGRDVPRDVSVMGFDDIPEAGYFRPPLTTVRQDFAVVGRRCIAQLLALMSAGEEPTEGPIQPTMVIRGSTAPPAGEPGPS